MCETTIDFDFGQPPTSRESVSVPTSDQCAKLKRRDDMGTTGPDAAKVVFNSYSTRLGWDFSTQADVLLNWCGEDMIEPLLQHIQETGQTKEFEKFLADNFGNDAPRPPGRRSSERAR